MPSMPQRLLEESLESLDNVLYALLIELDKTKRGKRTIDLIAAREQFDLRYYLKERKAKTT